MTLADAIELAELIEASEHWTVIAIGRFVLQEELQQAHQAGYASKLPWAVSVMAIDDVNDRAKLQSIAEWREYSRREPCQLPPKKPLTAKVDRTPAPAPAKAADEQLLLF